MRVAAALLVMLLVPTGCSADGTSEDSNASSVAVESEERAGERLKMVENQIVQRAVTDQLVIDAMRAVPRHRFVPDDLQRSAYNDHALPIGHGQTISQPYIVALMTDLVRPKRDFVVLEIGTGSGYQAAILAKLVKHVYSIEIIEGLANGATNTLKRLGYNNVTTKLGDGYYGWEEHGPYDAIVVTAAATHVPPPLVQQLKPGGRIVIPVGGRFMTQQLLLIEKNKKNELITRQMGAVRFVPLTRGR